MIRIAFLFFILKFSYCQHLACPLENRRPEGHSPIKNSGDGGFKIIVTGPMASQGFYAPNEMYTVTVQGLNSRISTQKMMEFLLVAESEKQAMMGPSGLVTTGIFHIVDEVQTRFSDMCPDGVTATSRQPKSEVSVKWTAPSILVASCITFKATVVERPHVWYMDDGQLTKTLCPQIPGRTPATTPTPPTPVLPPPPPPITAASNFTVTPRPTNKRTRQRTSTTTTSSTTTETIPMTCCACDDAKYDVIFEGHWSKETHPKDFPENEWLLHFSDIIGASHSPDIFLFKEGEIASEGIRHVAEWGATRIMETELKQQSKHINTIIKARGLWHPNVAGQTSAAFRVSRKHHLVSLVSMIGPSPDWIVGLPSFQLCLPNCTWMEEETLNLFPYDAGTDSGISYMSPNTPTQPQERVYKLSPKEPNDPRSPFHGLRKIPPFAKVIIRRQRIYPRSCSDTRETLGVDHHVIVSENSDDDSSRPECAVNDWTPWSECSVRCGKGLRMRKRSYSIPMKAEMMRCDRQLVEKEMCLGETSTCPPDEENEEGVEEIDSICSTTSWTEWSPCSVTCGEGHRTRSRRYKNHMGRKKCSLNLVQNEPCRGPIPECPKVAEDPDCPLSPWSEWAPCSTQCGKGFTIRTRLLLPSDDFSPVSRNCISYPLTERRECVGEEGMDCEITEEEAMELCTLEPDQGPCRDQNLRFYYNKGKRMCVPFSYGGCKGNKNRFETEQECRSVCGFLAAKTGITPTTTITPATTIHATEEPTPITLPYQPVTVTATTPRYIPNPITSSPRRSVFTWTEPTVQATTRTRVTQPSTTTAATTTTIPTTAAPFTNQPCTVDPRWQSPLFTNYLLHSPITYSPFLWTTATTVKPAKDTTTTMTATTTTSTSSRSPTTTTPTLSPDSEESFNLDLSQTQPVARTAGAGNNDEGHVIDCVVSAWGEWSSCGGGPCGALGVRTRKREVLVEPGPNGRRCPRKMYKRKTCVMSPCET